MTSRRTSILGLLAATALGLSACGSSEGGDTEPAASSSTSSSSTTSETPTSDTAEPAESDNSQTSDSSASAAPSSLTKPGTELALGEPATIPQGDGASIGLTVTKVTEGSSADLSVLKDADKYADFTPVYVHYTMSGTDSSSELGGDILDDIDPILADGQKANTLILIGTSPFEQCDSNSVPDDFGPGDTHTTCQVAMISPGQEVGGGQYAPYDGDYSDDGRVTWKQ